MQDVRAPLSLKNSEIEFSVLAHSVGGLGSGGDYAYAYGGGPYFTGKITVPALKADDYYDVRGFIHSLRGSNGSFLLATPSTPVPVSAAVGFGLLQWGGVQLQWGGVDLAWSMAITNNAIGGQYLSSLAAAAPRYATCITLAPNPSNLEVGTMLWIGPLHTGGQLVEVVAVGSQIEFRPWLRSAYALGTSVSIGSVRGKFRLTGDVPAIPFNGQYSTSFEIDFCEYY